MYDGILSCTRLWDLHCPLGIAGVHEVQGAIEQLAFLQLPTHGRLNHYVNDFEDYCFFMSGAFGQT